MKNSTGISHYDTILLLLCFDKIFLSYPRFKSKATPRDRSFTCAAPKVWNALPFDIKSARSVNIFKAKLKTHLFRHTFLSQLLLSL